MAPAQTTALRRTASDLSFFVVRGWRKNKALGATSLARGSLSGEVICWVLILGERSLGQGRALATMEIG